MADEITNREDTIDSRDIIERIEELESERSDLVDSITELEDKDAEEFTTKDKKQLEGLKADLVSWDESNADELKALQALTDELSDYCPDWEHGTTLIRETYWTEYCVELVKDIGDMPKEIPSYIVIDWDATADNLQADYTSGEFDGVTYWAR